MMEKSNNCHRELKFRAWDVSRKRWMKILDAEGIYNIPAPKLLNDGSMIVEQYTGLKDRDGKEIYEGDIVDTAYHNLSTFKEKGAVGMGVLYDSDGWNNESILGWRAGGSSLLDVHQDCKVIGNIHENLELLKEVEDE